MKAHKHFVTKAHRSTQPTPLCTVKQYPLLDREMIIKNYDSLCGWQQRTGVVAVQDGSLSLKEVGAWRPVYIHQIIICNNLQPQSSRIYKHKKDKNRTI